ncbi:MAG: toll/interleukin-1 receptor domain-containing protein [Pseudomonadota bacterium]
MFLSYASEDHAYADLVIEKLHGSTVKLEPDEDNQLDSAVEAKINVWRDTQNLRFGDDWAEEIDERLKSCHALLTILTPAATQSAYVTYEWCVATDNGAERARFIPMIFKDCKAHPKMRARQQFDARRAAKNWTGLKEYLASLAAPGSFDSPEAEATDISSASLAEEQRMVEAAAEDTSSEDQHSAAIKQIDDYLYRKGFTRISFERLRKLYGYDESFLTALVDKNADKLRFARLKDPSGKGSRMGLARKGGPPGPPAQTF